VYSPLEHREAEGERRKLPFAHRQEELEFPHKALDLMPNFVAPAGDANKQ